MALIWLKDYKNLYNPASAIGFIPDNELEYLISCPLAFTSDNQGVSVTNIDMKKLDVEEHIMICLSWESAC